MKLFLILGGASSFLSVSLGAFAAHFLKARLTDYSIGVFRTGVEYQLYHSLAIILIASIIDRFPGLKTSGFLFAGGIFFFSGSLYALALTGIKTFGAVTPIGGVLLLVGWALFVREAL